MAFPRHFGNALILRHGTIVITFGRDDYPTGPDDGAGRAPTDRGNMALFNTDAGYGSLTKSLHWLIAALFAFQFVAGHIMVRLPAEGRQLGLGVDTWFNWHKSIGLVALAIAVIRLWNRRQGHLPAWAPTLSSGEKTFIHRAERVLYAAMLVMPLSGFVYVMAGGFGVLLFGAWTLPNPIGAWPILATLAKWLHVGAGWVLAAALAGHIGLELRHQLLLRDGLLRRMLKSS